MLRDEVQIAKRLNELRRKTEVIKLDWVEEGKLPTLLCCGRDDRLWHRIGRILAEHWPDVDWAELRSAAEAERDADLDLPSSWYAHPRESLQSGSAHLGRLWWAAREAIEAEIAKTAQEAERRYQEYRRACIEGTAKPPKRG